jgi:fused signal recognition particle receptor
MSTPVLAALGAAFVIIVVVVAILARRKKVDGGAALPAAQEPRVDVPKKEVREAAQVEAPSPEIAKAETLEGPAPETPVVVAIVPAVEPAQEKGPAVVTTSVAEEAVPAPGVQLDESAERDAATQLQEAKRERKLRKLRQGLAQTRGGFIAKIGSIFKEKKTIDPALLNELEEALLTADVGAKTTAWLTSLLREALDKKELADPDAVWTLLKREVQHALSVEAKPIDMTAAKPHTIMVVGVNGVGKTTTIGKLASKFSEQGSKVVLAAADTFRAAAVNQLEIWGRRTKCEVVKSKEGADPSSVVFDAVKRAKEIGADIVIADTAGRLHTQVTLMEELKKVARVMGKAQDGAPHEVLLVLDATTGQNALQQVREFGESLALTGLVLTKLDGTAKGGVIIGVCHEHKIPVRYIGIGEAKDDLRDFEVGEFVDALFVRDEDPSAAGETDE